MTELPHPIPAPWAPAPGLGRVVLGALVALAAVSLLGCVARTDPAPYPGATYAPYDPETNPACGALGTCVPTDVIRINRRDQLD